MTANGVQVQDLYDDDGDESSSGEFEFDSEDEAIAERIWGREPGQAPRGPEDVIEFDQHNRCTHRVLKPDYRQEAFQRCFCTKVNYTTCTVCRIAINLSYSDILWPHLCMSCSSPLCVACANRCSRVDYAENVDRFYCDACIAKLPDSEKRAAVNWSVVYHVAQTDRDRRPYYQLLPLPFQLDSYADAREGAIAGLSLLGTGPLWEHVAKVFENAFATCGDSGVVYDIDTGELHNGDETTRVTVRLSRLHPKGTRILAPPAYRPTQ